MVERVVSARIIAFLEVGQPIGTEKPWLGWNIMFVRTMTPKDIQQRKPKIEECLNEYLMRNVDVVKNNLIVPFTCEMTASTLGPKPVFQFKVQVFSKGKKYIKVPFKYPSEPITRIDGFVLVKGSPVGSQIDSVAIQPPPN